MRMPAARTPRHGLSLLEVIVALAIFVLSIAAIGQLTTVTSNLAVETRWRVEGQSLCQSKLAEVVAGAVPLQSVGDQGFDEDPDWTWALDSQASGPPGLYQVTITVSRARQGAEPFEIAMKRWILDPALRGSTDPNSLGTDDPAATTGTSSTSGTSSTGSSSSSSGSSGSKP